MHIYEDQSVEDAARAGAGYTLPPRFPTSQCSGPYTAQLLGWSEEQIACRDFIRLVEAIRWVVGVELDGAIAHRARICSAQGAVVWARLFRPRRDQRLEAMKQNAARILVRAFDLN